MRFVSDLLSQIIITQVVLAFLCVQFELEMVSILALLRFSFLYTMFLFISVVLAVYLAFIVLRTTLNGRAGQRVANESREWE
ncbi:hypothetical protein [uncultured Methylophaga sp.]|uniref:hypothetical protein n=1 Tax=uncultured Methylophaga sp. TaxID=285271 RepID=UPI0026037C37|nr:hypothetical protein [uncultured Methylophaga sp.]